jgi:hypothetical protein
MTYGVSEQLAELFREKVNGTLGSEIVHRACVAAAERQAAALSVKVVLSVAELQATTEPHPVSKMNAPLFT